MSNFKSFMSEEFAQRDQGMNDQRLLSPDHERMLWEFRNGKPIGSPCHIPQLSKIFSWKRGFQYCFTGNPNAGKTTFTLFLMLIKSMVDGWKWLIWTPEMLDSYTYRELGKKKVKITATDVYDELIYMRLGKNIYKHYETRYGYKQCSEQEYAEGLEWVKKYFFVIQPEDNKYQSLIDNFQYFYETLGTDGFLADPFKNLIFEDNARADNILHRAFADVNLMAKDTDSVWIWIAHPKSMTRPIGEDSTPRVVSAFDLAGGAAWYNSMDFIGSYHRPNIHIKYSDPMGEFHSLKIRKQQLVGLPGSFENIEFLFRSNRFYFDGVCPVDGSSIN